MPVCITVHNYIYGMNIMIKRFAHWILVVAVGMLCQLPLATSGHAQSNTIGYPSTTQCPNTAPAIKTGTDPGFPGQWWNPQRYGTGWDFYFSSNASQIDINWMTFNAKHQPIWLTNGGGSTMQIATNGGKQFWAPLYLVVLTPSSTTPTQTSTQVGEVSISFVPGSTTIAALRWKWNAVGTAAQPDECVFDFVHGSPTGTGAASINESYTGDWFASSQSGWGLDISVGTYTTGNTTTNYEIDNALIYDTAGQPVWLQASAQNTTTASTTLSLGYAKSNYPAGFPTSNCSNSNCITPHNAVGSVTRALPSSQSGTSTVTANVAGSVTGTTTIPGAAVAWPNAPYTNPVAISKLTDYNYVAVNQTNCQIPFDQTTCTVVVAWASTNTSSQVFRRDLTTNIISSTPISSASSGQYSDHLALGADVRYELHNTTSTGTLFYTSAEVKVSAAPSPTCTSEAPASASISSTATTQRISAYGVQNATSVVFPTWWIPGGQSDLQWLQGTNAGNGTWYADVTLAQFDPGNPR